MPNRGTLGGYTRGLHQQVPGVQKSLILRGFLEAVLRWRRGRDTPPPWYYPRVFRENQQIRPFRGIHSGLQSGLHFAIAAHHAATFLKWRECLPSASSAGKSSLIRRPTGCISPAAVLLYPHDARESASLTRVKYLQLSNAIVGAAEPPTKLAVDILHHHHIRVDVGLVASVEVSRRELIQHDWALRDDGD
jgi:hypothetical protein